MCVHHRPQVHPRYARTNTVQRINQHCPTNQHRPTHIRRRQPRSEAQHYYNSLLTTHLQCTPSSVTVTAQLLPPRGHAHVSHPVPHNCPSQRLRVLLVLVILKQEGSLQSAHPSPPQDHACMGTGRRHIIVQSPRGAGAARDRRRLRREASVSPGRDRDHSAATASQPRG